MIDSQVGQVVDKRFGLLRRKRLAEKLINCVQIYRQGKDLAPGGGFNPVGIGHKFGELIQIFPNPRVVGVEDMRTVLMY